MSDDLVGAGISAAVDAAIEQALGSDVKLPGVRAHDVLSGRGATVNGHVGNKRFRELCFERKPEFDEGDHTAKRRIASEVVDIVKSLDPPGRFLKRMWEGTPKKGAGAEAEVPREKGPWIELDADKAILKACQVMRDFQRPDRIALKQASSRQGGSAKKKRKAVAYEEPAHIFHTGERIIPTTNDVLSGRGAFVNAHPGNQRLRALAIERKDEFDKANQQHKRTLANEIVGIIQSLNPPGRFLRRRVVTPTNAAVVLPPRGIEGDWYELPSDRAVHKACQVMRDIRRPDRMNLTAAGMVDDGAVVNSMVDAVHHQPDPDSIVQI